MLKVMMSEDKSSVVVYSVVWWTMNCEHLNNGPIFFSFVTSSSL